MTSVAMAIAPIASFDAFNLAFFMGIISISAFPVFVASTIFLGERQSKIDLIALLAATISFSIFFQQFFARPRPVGALFKHPESPYSFPSTHSSSAFAWAEFMSIKFVRYKILFYVFALLVAVSRVYVGVHYPIDVIAGAAFGWLAARVVTRAEHEA